MSQTTAGASREIKSVQSCVCERDIFVSISRFIASILVSSLQLFSIVIFGCIANEGYINRPNEVEEYCIFNRNQNACNYGVFMGSMAFLCCMALLALDIYFPQISSVKDRKKAVLADVGVSGVFPGTFHTALLHTSHAP